MRRVLSEAARPLDDGEQAYLYAVCRQHSAHAYTLVRRLVKYGMGPNVARPAPSVPRLRARARLP